MKILWHCEKTLVLACMVFIGTLFSKPIHAQNVAARKSQPNLSATLDRGHKAFKAGDYDNAITYFRQFLNRRPKDYNTWNYLAASYYHTGLPSRAARYLKYVEKKTTLRSYNFYYQGLVYQTLKKNGLARQKLAQAARFSDSFGAQATFELAVLEYNASDFEKASYWINQYLQRFPAGSAATTCRQMAQSIQTGTPIEGLEGNKKPDMEKALFRYNRYSLSPNPHYWFVQLGYLYNQLSGKAPDQGNTLKDQATQDFALMTNAGIGYGPIRQGDALAFGGYTYRQRWSSDMDRLNDFFDGFDPTFFPFRGDIMERRHELYGDYRHQIVKNVFAGTFARKEFLFGGSNLIPGPDQPDDVTASVNISDTTLILPWIGISYLDNYYTLLYLYFRKEINSLSQDLSNKTFSLFDSEDAVFSFGISHNMEFPKNKLKINAELFQYEFIYNDYWLDYNRMGAILAAEYEFYPQFFIRPLAGFYTDVYILDQLKQSQCKYVKEDAGGTSSYPKTCRRTDSGQLFEITGIWNYSQFHRLEVTTRHVTNANPELAVYDRARTLFFMRLTWAFPSAERVIRYVDRFADTAFTKQAE